MSVPYNEFTVGTWAGDVLLNSNYDFTSLDDLYAVMVHEAGHVLGLAHSNNPLSPMHVHGISESVVPLPEDIAQLRKVFGITAVEEPAAGSQDRGADQSEHDEHGQEHEHQEKHEEEHANDGERLDDERNERASTGGPVAASSPHSDIAHDSLHYHVAGRLTAPGEVDQYELRLSRQTMIAQYLTITARAFQPGTVVPQVEVTTRDGQRVDGEILARGDGTFVLQVPNVASDGNYRIAVRSGAGAAPFQPGAYHLEVQFANQPTHATRYFTQTLRAGRAQSQQLMRVTATSLARFMLSVQPVATRRPISAWAEIYDVRGRMVNRISAAPGETRSGTTVLLAPGDYRVVFRVAGSARARSPEVSFALEGTPVSWPIGPVVVDPTSEPALPPADGTSDAPLNPDLVVTDPVIYPVSDPFQELPTAITEDPPWLDPAWWSWQEPASAEAVP